MLGKYHIAIVSLLVFSTAVSAQKLSEPKLTPTPLTEEQRKLVREGTRLPGRRSGELLFVGRREISGLKKMSFINKQLFVVILLMLSALAANAQESKKYAKDGVSFEYDADWELTEKVGKDSDEISLSNAGADSQISLAIVRKRVESKDPMPELRKQVIDPWIASMIDQYKKIANIDVQRSDVKTQVAGEPTDGVKLAFTLDGQQGSVEACWALLGKRLVLLYLLRPDKKAEKATPGWDRVRSSIRIGSEEKK